MKSLKILRKIFVPFYIIILLFGCASVSKTLLGDKEITVTLSEFAKIENGMTLIEVEKIIGGSCEIMSEVGEKGTQFYTVTYGCNGKGTLGANAIFMYQSGKLMAKSQVGLE